MRVEHWLNGLRSSIRLRRRRRRISAAVASIERLEPRIALGDVAFTAMGFHGLQSLLAAPEFAGGGHAG